LERDKAEFAAKNAQIVALAVQNQNGATQSAQFAEVSYPILADPDHAITELFGVYDLLGDGVAAPAVFIIDQAGQITWSHIGVDLGDRPANQVILQNLSAK